SCSRRRQGVRRHGARGRDGCRGPVPGGPAGGCWRRARWRRLRMAEIKGPRVSFEGLKGAEKAAVVLLALGEEQATGLMSRLDETELAQVTRAMATFGKLPPELVREAARALEDLVLKGAAISGGALSTERLLSRFLPPERVSEIMTEIRGPAGRTTWEKL